MVPAQTTCNLCLWSPTLVLVTDRAHGGCLQYRCVEYGLTKPRYLPSLPVK